MEAIGTDDELQKGNDNSLPHLVGLKEKNIWRSGPHWTHVNLKTSKYYEEYFDIRADWLKMINIKIVFFPADLQFCFMFDNDIWKAWHLFSWWI